MDRDEMVMNIHLHLSRADGERPELVKITNGNWLEEKYLRERNFEKVMQDVHGVHLPLETPQRCMLRIQDRRTPYQEVPGVRRSSPRL
jgi:hypothetical protein